MLHRIVIWAQKHRRTLLYVAIGLIGLLLIIQLLYPRDRVPLYTTIDRVSVGGWHKKDAVYELDARMMKNTVAVKLGDAIKAYAQVTPAELGIAIDNSDRVTATGYPWYIRLVPSSLLWYGPLQQSPPAKTKVESSVTTDFVEKSLGDSCKIPAKNASLTYKNKSLIVVPAAAGGICELGEAVAAVKQYQPNLERDNTVRIPVKKVEASIDDASARALRKKIITATENGVRLRVPGEQKQILLAQELVLSWLTFSSKIDTLSYAVDAKKAESYASKTIKPLVVKPAGESFITTRDFTVISKKVGATGESLALDSTLSTIKKVIEGTDQSAQVFTKKIPPKETYKRSYTKTSTGMSALLAHYADDHAGVYGVAFQELSGQGRAAEINANKSFTTASTYKLFVAYGTLRNIDSGKWKWTDKDIASGRNLSTCFDDMIVKSDNACAESLLKKLGLTTLTNDIRQLGLASSGFTTGDTPVTTAGDLQLFLTRLESGSLPLKSASEQRLLSAMKRNVYRQGIPAGTSGTVANKVGFLWGLLHDAAVVYSPNGTYVLVVLTDGSSWSSIAELTKRLESLR